MIAQYRDERAEDENGVNNDKHQLRGILADFGLETVFPDRKPSRLLAVSENYYRRMAGFDLSALANQ
jgi:hypothetical protein